MGKLLFSILNIILSSGFSRVLLGAGLGLASGLGILTLINTFITSAVSNMSSGLPDILSFMSLLGVDVFLSITLGALVTRATIQSAQVSLSKLTKD